MSNPRGGFYSRLKDNRLPWEDKVKLIKYAWKSDTVRLPNKHQLLLDILSLSVIGKKRVTGEEAGIVWRCLREVLHTRACHRITSRGQAPLLKPQLFQVILDELDAAATMGKLISIQTQTLLDCCYCVVTSPTLSRTFTIKYEYMIQLLSITLRLCQLSLEADTADSPEPDMSNDKMLLDIIIITTDKFTKVIGNKASPQQAAQQVAVKLLGPAMSVLSTFSKSQKSEHQSIIRSFSDLFTQALLSRDLLPYYHLYVKSKMGKSDLQAPNSIETIFTKLTCSSQQEERVSAVCGYLVQYYSSLLQQYHSVSDRTLAFPVLQVLWGCLFSTPGAHPDTDTARTSSLVAMEIRMESLHDLLKLVAENDIHEMAEAEDGEQKTWLTSLIQWLLALPDRSEWRVRCLEKMVDINYIVTEKYLPRLLSLALYQHVDDSRDDKLLTSHCCLLCTVLHTYHRLRQIKKLIIQIVKVVQQENQDKDIVWPEKLLERFGSVISDLPQNTVVDVWRCLLSAITAEKEGPTTNKAESSLFALSDLIATFLLNVKVADYSITQQVASQVDSLMTSTHQVVVNIIIQTLKDKDRTCPPCFLHLLHSWGELKLMLCCYGENKLPEPSLSTAGDLTYLHGAGMTAEHWQRIQKLAEKHAFYKTTHVMMLLVAQKARSYLLADEASPHVVTNIRNCAHFLLCQTPSYNKICGHVWNGQYGGVTADTFPVASLSVICDNLRWLWNDADELYRARLTSTMIDCLTENQQSQSLEEDVQHPRFSPQGIVMRTMCGSEVLESRPVLDQLLVSLWQRMLPTDHSSSPSPKKKKRRSNVSGDVFNDLMQKVIGSSEYWDQVVTKDSEQQDTAVQLKNMIAETVSKKDKTQQSPSCIKKRILLLKMLRSLPLEYLSVRCKARCIVGLIYLMADLPSDLCDLTHILATTGYHVLTQLMSSSKSHQVALVTILPIDVMLPWLQTFEVVHKDKDITGLHHCPLQTLLLRCAARDDEMVGSLVTPFSQLVHKVRSIDLTVVNVQDIAVMQSLVSSLRVLTMECQRLVAEDATFARCREYLSLLHTVIQEKTVTVVTDACSPLYLSLLLLAASSLLDYTAKNKQESGGLWDHIVSTLPQSADMCTGVCQAVKGMLGRKETPSLVADLLASVSRYLRTLCYQWPTVFEHAGDAWPQATFTEFLINQWCQLVDILIIQTDNHLIENNDTHRVESSTRVQTTQTVGMVLLASQEGFASEGYEGRRHLDEMRATADKMLCVIVNTVPPEDLHHLCQELIQKVDVDSLDNDTSHLLVSMEIWQRVITFDLKAESCEVVKHACQELLMKVEHVLLEAGMRTQLPVDVICAGLATVSCMLTRGQSFLPPSSVSIALAACHTVSLVNSDHAAFPRLYRHVCQVTSDSLIHNGQAISKCVEVFTASLRVLIQAVVIQGSQQRSQNDHQVSSVNEDHEAGLVQSAHLLFRLCSLLENHAADFGKVAVYLVAEYIAQVQTVTILPNVKRAVLPAVHKLLDLCDEHSVALLRATLTSAGRQIFSVLYTDYVKYYKYQGKI